MKFGVIDGATPIPEASLAVQTAALVIATVILLVGSIAVPSFDCRVGLCSESNSLKDKLEIPDVVEESVVALLSGTDTDPTAFVDEFETDEKLADSFLLEFCSFSSIASDRRPVVAVTLQSSRVFLLRRVLPRVAFLDDPVFFVCFIRVDRVFLATALGTFPLRESFSSSHRFSDPEAFASASLSEVMSLDFRVSTAHFCPENYVYIMQCF